MSTDYTPTTAEDWMPTDMQVEVAFMAAPGHMTGPGDRHRAYKRWLDAHDREVAAKALEDYAAILDQEHAEDAARSRVADVRCLDCNLRHDERDEYSCGQPGHGHYYAPDSLAHAATVTIAPTWDGNQARARAAALRIEGKEDQ